MSRKSRVTRLPDQEQVSDEFCLYYGEEGWVAIRSDVETLCHFCISGLNKDTVVAEAVDRIHQAILAAKQERLIPHWDDENKKVIWK